MNNEFNFCILFMSYANFESFNNECNMIVMKTKLERDIAKY